MVVEKKLVSLIIPFYNESKGIAPLYQALLKVLDKAKAVRFEVICVDDGSRDDTLDKLIALSRKDSRFHIIELSRNFGKEAALTAGIDWARGEAVIPFDADLQDPPELIPEMIERWQKGAEVVLARRADRSSDSFVKRHTAQLFYYVHNHLSEVPIPPDVGDFRLMDRMVVEHLKRLPERQRFMKGLFAWVGFKAVTLEYVRPARHCDESSFSGWKLWNFALEGITGFGSAPLKIWTYIGLTGALVTFVYALVIIFKTLVYGVDVPGYASILVAILFFGSLQLVGIGLLGEYIGRIYMEAKQRPLYIIRRQYGGEDGS